MGLLSSEMWGSGRSRLEGTVGCIMALLSVSLTRGDIEGQLDPESRAQESLRMETGLWFHWGRGGVGAPRVDWSILMEEAPGYGPRPQERDGETEGTLEGGREAG